MCVLKFVLSAYNVQLLIGLIEGRLQAEGLGAEVAALGVARVQLGVQILRLRFPLSNNLEQWEERGESLKKPTLSKFFPLFSVMIAAA